MLARRAFSKHFQSWDMTLPCIEYEVDKFPPRFAGGYTRCSRGPDGQTIKTLYLTPGYKITDRGLYGCYSKWLSEKFPNLRHLSLPAFSGEMQSGPDCDCPACRFIRVRSSDCLGITAILESLGAFKNLTSLEWKGCPKLQDAHLEAISETLPQLECLILDCEDDADDFDDSGDDAVGNKGFAALAKLTSLRKLHLQVKQGENFNDYPITSAGPAFLTTLNQLTSLTCRCKMSPGDEAGEDLKRISRMVQLRELDLLGSGFDGGMDDDMDDDGGMEKDEKMRNKYLTPLKSLTNLCKLRLPVSRGWTKKGMENLLQRLPNVSGHNDWYYQRY